MRNPESQPILPICDEKNQKPIVFGIKQDDLTEEAMEAVFNAYVKFTGTPIPNKWIFCCARIESALGLRQGLGNDSLSLGLTTGVGEVVLSVRKQEGLLIFDLEITKEGKPPHLISYYNAIERGFKERVNKSLCDLGVAQGIDS